MTRQMVRPIALPLGLALASALLTLLFVGLLLQPIAASSAEDTAADSVAAAFTQARQAAHLSSLERMGRNSFRGQVCKQDFRFPSGLINDVRYETSDPANLPEPARRLATARFAQTVAARFAVGVCLLDTQAATHRYSVVIALYESRWNSFWRIFD